ncbi:N-acetylmuramoyl-L-alanine amidase [Castellaniella sp.]|uniref:N-acetylmuramoyl-L-alanine amidase n=1 Tax=Castellaniella sp. TaxID=1955812 RepID=UPI002AFEB38F|nr:N-acetylmuramoyl-L-alanine amidase [Castellaniella sp.]
MAKIVITAGHATVDRPDSGAVYNGRKESEVMTAFRNIVALKLRQAGHEVITDGEGKENQTLNTAIRLIKAHKPDYALEFHTNASTSPAASGVETISLPKDKDISRQISHAISRVLSLRVRGDRGWIDQSQSARGKLGYVNAGGIIVETFFISSRQDLAVWEEKQWLVATEIAKLFDDKL